MCSNDTVQKDGAAPAKTIVPRVSMRYTKMTCACHVGQQMTFWNDGGVTIEDIPGHEADKENIAEDPEWILKDKPAGYKNKFGH